MLSEPCQLALTRPAVLQSIRVRTPIGTRIRFPAYLTRTVASPGATPVTVPVLETRSTLRLLLVNRAPLTSSKEDMPS
jgi:hypothetical protein